MRIERSGRKPSVRHRDRRISGTASATGDSFVMPTRRALLLQAAMLSTLSARGFAQTRGNHRLPLEPTPACGAEPAAPTPASEEGPSYTRRPPRRPDSLGAGMAGSVLGLGGRGVAP